MKVLYNKYDKLDKVAAGASFYYYELSKLLGSQNEERIKFIPFDFKDIFSTNILSGLTKEDVVIPNIGPYSWVYYYLRDKNKLKFRIIHDVQTALFADHILQEQLCENYIREGDRILFLSNYQRQLYIHMFPNSLRDDNTFVCNPILLSLPFIDSKEETKQDSDSLEIGWIGRVFDAKNFDQALQIFIRLYNETDGKVNMKVCGLADEKYQPDNVKKALMRRGIDPLSYNHINNGEFVSYEGSLKLMKEVDVLLFPSTANMESLGRVMIEANQLRTKVLAAHHGAAQELLPDSNLVKVDYNYNNAIDLNTNQSMGRISEDDAVNSLLNIEKLSLGDNSFYENHDEKLKKIILGESGKDNIKLDNKTKEFIEKVNIFLNGDYNINKEEALKKAMCVIKNNLKEGLDIVKTSLAVRQALNYKPYLILKQ